MSPIRVLFDHEIFSRQRFGGISRYFTQLIPRLSQMDELEVSAFLGVHSNAYGLGRSSGQFRSFAGVRTPPSAAARQAARLNRFALRPFAARVRPDVYHLTTYRDFLPGRRVKRVITLHDLIWNRFPDLVQPGPSITPHKELILAADAVICISESTRRDAEEFFGLPRERTTIVHHANSLELPASSRPPAPIDFPYLLFVGHRAGYKNFALLLRSVQASARLRAAFRIVCFGPSISDSERAEIAALGLADRVLHVPGEDQVLADLYAHAAAFVYPSLYEGFGIPLLEAMHYGCPVLAARASCFPEIAADAAAYFDPASPDDLAQKLEQVVFNPSEKARLVAAGREREARFSWEEAARRTTGVYKHLVR